MTSTESDARSSSTTPEGATSRPSGLPRILSVTLTLAAVTITLLGLRQVGSFVGPVFLGLNLMLVAAPLFSWLVRIGVPRVLASISAVLAVYAFLVVFVLSLWWSISVLVNEIPAYASKFQELYLQLLDRLQAIGVSETMLTDQVASIDKQQIVGLATDLAKGIGDGVSIMAIVVTVLVFLSMDAIDIKRRIQLVRDAHPTVADALTRFGDGVRRYWVVTTVFGLIVAVIDVVALGIIGVPFALVWGVLSFVTNYIPNIGFVLGLVPPTLIALLDKGVAAAIAVVVVYSVANFVVQAIIQPKYAGDAVGVTPTVSFLSLLLWAWVFGATGALLALPATLLLKAFLVDADPRGRWVNALIASRIGGGEPSEPDDSEADESDSADPGWTDGEPDEDLVGVDGKSAESAGKDGYDKPDDGSNPRG